MFQIFKKKLPSNHTENAKETAKLVVEEVNQLLSNHQNEINKRIDELKAHIRTIDTNIELLERKIILKELSDRKQYGQLHYKLNEVGQGKLRQEIEELRENLVFLKTNE